jgi:ABC-type lipoprotein release transport system permease subunit
MHLSEILKLAAGALSANKLRSGLTMLGIAVGVFSVIGVMTVTTMFQKKAKSSQTASEASAAVADERNCTEKSMASPSHTPP